MSQPAETYMGVPGLRQLLPTGGIPGKTYAFIAAKNLITAQEHGYDIVPRPGFWLTNGKDREGAVLMCKGKANAALASSSGARKLMIDPDLEALFPTSEPAKEAPKPKGKPQEPVHVSA